jgi:hypothetical protein
MANDEQALYCAVAYYTAEEHKEIVDLYARRIKHLEAVLTRLRSEIDPAYMMAIDAELHYEALPRASRTMLRHLPIGQYVYVVQERQGRMLYKIGMTTTPRKRLQQLDTSNAYGVRLCLLMQVDDAAAVENDLHKHFAKQRVNHEWFRLYPNNFPIMVYKTMPRQAWVMPVDHIIAWAVELDETANAA